MKEKENFLINLIEGVCLKDIGENQVGFEELPRVISSDMESPCNPTKLYNTFKSTKGIFIDKKDFKLSCLYGGCLYYPIRQ